MTARPSLTSVALAAPASLGVPGRANANVSFASEGGLLVAVWSASTPTGTTDIYAAVSRDAGARFGPPVRVNSTAGDARVNAEQPPRVALRPRGTATPEIAVVWTAKATAGTRLLSAVSADGGRSFAAATVVPGSEAPGNRGWEALGVGPGQRLFAVWLDHRDLAAQGTATPAEHQHTPGMTMTAAPAADGVAQAQRSQLYVAALDRATPPVAVSRGVCYCCKTAVAAAGTSALYVAWRHVYPGNMRDIAFAASRDGGRTFSAPVRVSEDRWQLEGCPDDGPAMGVDGSGRIHLVWPSVVTDAGGPVKALFYATSTDGRAFTPRQRLPTQGQANHPQLSVTREGRLAVGWDESGAGPRRVVWATAAAPTTGSAPVFERRSALSAPGTYPVLVPAGSDWLAAWTTGPAATSSIALATIR